MSTNFWQSCITEPPIDGKSVIVSLTPLRTLTRKVLMSYFRGKWQIEISGVFIIVDLNTNYPDSIWIEMPHVEVKE